MNGQPRSASSGSGGNRRVWVIALLVAVIFTVLGTPRAAWAHNALVATSPSAGATVARAPAVVVLTFNEPAIATGTKVLVTGPDGPVTQGDPTLVDTTVRQRLRTGLPAGEYTVEWRVTSADGHPVNGTFTFRARTGDETASTATPAERTPPPSPSSSPAPGSAGSDGEQGGSSPWLLLLAIIPVGLAALLGWRFRRGPSGEQRTQSTG